LKYDKNSHKHKVHDKVMFIKNSKESTAIKNRSIVTISECCVDIPYDYVMEYDGFEEYAYEDELHKLSELGKILYL